MISPLTIHITNLDRSVPKARWSCPLFSFYCNLVLRLDHHIMSLLADVGGVSVHNLHLYRWAVIFSSFNRKVHLAGGIEGTGQRWRGLGALRRHSWPYQHFMGNRQVDLDLSYGSQGPKLCYDVSVCHYRWGRTRSLLKRLIRGLSSNWRISQIEWNN